MKVLLIDNDLNSTDQVREILADKGYEVVSAMTGEGGVAQAQLERPGIVLLDIDLPGEDGLAVCRALRALGPPAQLPILIHTARAAVEDKVAGFRAGANDYMVKPIAPVELLARVRAALGPAAQLPQARIITVWGSKGGVGTTTIAGNLAVALKNRTGGQVTLLDASVLAGTLGLMLNLPPQHTMTDLMERIDSLDAELLASVLIEHSSGVRALLSAPWSTNGHGLQPAHLDRILDWLRESNDYVVIDTAPSLDAATVAALEMADKIVVVVTPELTALRNARLFLSIASTWGIERENMLLVLNRQALPGGIPSKDVHRALQTPLDVQLANDDALVTRSVNRGIPLVLSHRRSRLARQVSALADAVLAGLGEEPVSPSTSRWSLQRLFTHRRKA